MRKAAALRPIFYRIVAASVLLCSSACRDHRSSETSISVVSFAPDIVAESLTPARMLSQLDDSTFFDTISSITYSDAHGYVVTLPRAQSVHVLDDSLRPVLRLEDAGDGPGELSLPLHAFVDGNELFVWERERVQVFDLRLEYLRSFAIPSGMRKPAVLDGVFYTGNSVDSLAISILSRAGDLLASFGPRIHAGRLNSRMLDYRMLAASNTGGVVATYNAEPRVELYDRDGELRAEVEIGDAGPVSPLFKQVAEANVDFEREGVPGYLREMFADLSLNGRTLYILCTGFKGKGDGTYVLVLSIDANDATVTPSRILRLLGPGAETTLVVSILARSGKLFGYDTVFGGILVYEL